MGGSVDLLSKIVNIDIQEVRFNTGETIKVNPAKSGKQMVAGVVHKGQSVVIERPGYMDEAKKAHKNVRVRKLVSIAGAEPAYMKESHLPGRKSSRKRNVKNI